MMYRQYRGVYWAKLEQLQVLIYQQYRAEVATTNPGLIIWEIYDDTPDVFNTTPRLVASGVAISIMRACFMVETWLDGTRGKS